MNARPDDLTSSVHAVATETASAPADTVEGGPGRDGDLITQESGTKISPPRGGLASSVRRRARGVLIVIVVLVGIAWMTYPLAATLALPLGELTDVLGRAGDVPNLDDVFINTALLAVGVVVVSQIIGIALSLCAMRLGGRWLSIGTGLAVAPVFFPSLSMVVGWALLFSPNVGYGNQILRATPFFSGSEGPIDVYTLPWIIGITSVYLVPYVFIFVATALREMDSAQESAARISGAGWLRAQLDVVLPAVRPAIIYGIVICLLLALGQFTAPLLLGRDARVSVVTTEMYRLSTDFQADRPLAALLGVPAILAAFVLVGIQRRRVGSLTRYATTSKGTGGRTRTQRRFFIPLAGFFVITVIPPTIALVIVSMSTFWSGDISWAGMSLENYRDIFADDRFYRALMNTFQLSAAGTAIAVIASFAASRFLLTSERRIRGLVDYMVNLPVAVPGIIFGLGVFLSFATGPLGWYGSRWLFVIAWVIAVLPHGVRILLAGQARIGRDLVSSARLAGSPAWHAVLLVVLPLLRRAMAAAALLMFVIMSHEFAAAALLRTVQNDVLSTFLYEGWQAGRYPMVAAVALIMVVVTAIGAGACLLLGGRDPFDRTVRKRWWHHDTSPDAKPGHTPVQTISPYGRSEVK